MQEINEEQTASHRDMLRKNFTQIQLEHENSCFKGTISLHVSALWPLFSCQRAGRPPLLPRVVLQGHNLNVQLLAPSFWLEDTLSGHMAGHWFGSVDFYIFCFGHDLVETISNLWGSLTAGSNNLLTPLPRTFFIYSLLWAHPLDSYQSSPLSPLPPGDPWREWHSSIACHPYK